MKRMRVVLMVIDVLGVVLLLILGLRACDSGTQPAVAVDFDWAAFTAREADESWLWDFCLTAEEPSDCGGGAYRYCHLITCGGAVNWCLPDRVDDSVCWQFTPTPNPTATPVPTSTPALLPTATPTAVPLSGGHGGGFND